MFRENGGVPEINLANVEDEQSLNNGNAGISKNKKEEMTLEEEKRLLLEELGKVLKPTREELDFLKRFMDVLGFDEQKWKKQNNLT